MLIFKRIYIVYKNIAIQLKMKIDFYLLRKDIVFSNSIKPFQNAKTIIIVPVISLA